MIAIQWYVAMDKIHVLCVLSFEKHTIESYAPNLMQWMEIQTFEISYNI